MNNSNKNFKDSWNEIMFDFISYINDKDKNSDYLDKIKNQKQDIILYLYFVLFTMNNIKPLPNINSIEEFSSMMLDSSSKKLAVGKNNDVILKTIRNSFAHS